ncbi:HlyD family secretion protein [Vibrio coralliilyticus]|uniref:HlyD family secretion protein n=1 Tax=Vibrio coralliilyticus TaxID=190893 RepID=UPI00155F57E6|nr:HlyD family efflux transporter periplasmic adaptor subunit [Vibrio coralliilyticus]NRF13038.1 HlyD family efflux transporter periplasmic adaptor subunit [Vibrio coralliilyticus]
MKRFLIGSVLISLLTACTQDDSSQALGTLERDRVTFTATANEIIRALPATEGSQVKQGEVLVQLDTTSQEAVLARAVAEQSKAEAYLLKLTNGERPEDIAASQARVKRAEAQLTEAQKNYTRKAELVEKRLISQSEEDTALAARDSAKAELDSAKEEFSKLTAGSRLEDIEQAKAELAASVADVTLQQQKLSELTITATRDGVLDNLPYNLGERVPVNGVVAVIQASRVPYARVYVPASHRVEFVPGKSVSVTVDGVESPISGTVRWVASEPSFTPYYALTEDERSRLMYLAEVDLESSAQRLPSGIPAQIDLSGE